MFSVEETLPDGRRRALSVRAVPAESSGPVRFAVGRTTGSAPAVPTPRPPVDDLVVIARAVGVIA